MTLKVKVTAYTVLASLPLLGWFYNIQYTGKKFGGDIFGEPYR